MIACNLPILSSVAPRRTLFVDFPATHHVCLTKVAADVLPDFLGSYLRIRSDHDHFHAEVRECLIAG